MRLLRTSTHASSATLLTLLAALLLVGLVPGSASAAGYSGSLTATIDSLPVSSEVRTGYDRDLFRHWIDADGDGCHTRSEVLLAEADTAPTRSGTCTLSGGRWYSYYDGVSVAGPTDLDIDHVVPLAESWDSGSRTWSASRREAFANDLGDHRSLIAVTASSNRAKGDQDPTSWMPASQQCRYITDWVAVKKRWGLSVDSAEKSRLRSVAAGCADVTITVQTV